MKTNAVKLVLLATILGISGCQSPVTEPVTGINDGPYIEHHDHYLLSRSVCQGRPKIEKLNLTPQAVSGCDFVADVHQLVFTQPLLEFNGNFKVAALSDMHGQFDLSVTLLQNNGIIDQNLNWAFADGHLVITGDVFDRGDKVTEILWLLFKLEKQAKQAGGQLHLLLGNHEVMILNGDLRYLNPKYTQVADILSLPFTQLFDQKSVLGQWLRSLPVLVKINGNLFAHGGFHPELAKAQFSLADINQLFKANLVKHEQTSARQGWGEYLHRTNGPIWYRGYFKDDGATDTEIALLLNHFNVDKIIVGHTSQQQIEQRYQGKVIAIDTSIKNGQYGEVLFIENQQYYRGKLNGERDLLN